MKNLKDILSEDFFKNVGSTPEDNKKRKTIPLIEEWLKEYNIKNYTINKDLTIDVNGSVFLQHQFIQGGKFPEYIQFNKVTGDFQVHSSTLTSLRGCPKVVEGSFFCGECDLTSLEGGPEIVSGDFICSYCDKLKALKGHPRYVKGVFDCSYCKSLKDNPYKLKNRFGYLNFYKCDNVDM